MKKLSLVLLAMLAFSFVGCEGWLNIDDPTPDPETEPDPDPEVEAVITLEETSATLHYGETYQINAECEFPITYTSENEFFASVSDEGLVTANHVGTTMITLEAEADSQTFEVTIEPLSDLYPEPEIEIGQTKEDVIARYGEPDAVVDDAIGYRSYSDNATMMMVMFDENGLVELYAVIFELYFEEELETFLTERYLFVQEEENVKMYINALNVEEATMIVGSEVAEEEAILMAFYMGNENGGGDEKTTVNMKALLKALRK